ncbi:TPA: helix-turn-helix domain-containing protein, partial [Klebsiella pneumoniae]
KIKSLKYADSAHFAIGLKTRRICAFYNKSGSIIMLGYELRLWRKGCGWTQERAAEEFDVSLRTYQMYEKNQRDIPLLAERATRELQLRLMLREFESLTKEQILQRLQTLLNTDNPCLA